MILRPRKVPSFQYEVVIDFVSGGEVANLMRGFISAAGEKIRFTGVAYGRFGGQNVFPKFSPAAKKKVARIFGDAEKLADDLQQRLVSGDFEVRPKPGTAPPAQEIRQGP
jgi:hypothetical protein